MIVSDSRQASIQPGFLAVDFRGMDGGLDEQADVGNVDRGEAVGKLQAVNGALGVLAPGDAAVDRATLALDDAHLAQLIPDYFPSMARFNLAGGRLITHGCSFA